MAAKDSNWSPVAQKAKIPYESKEREINKCYDSKDEAKSIIYFLVVPKY